MVTYPGDWATYPFKRFFTLLPNNTLSRDKLSSVGEIGNIHYGDVLIKYGDIITDKDAIPRIKDDAGYIPKCFLQKNDVILADTAEDEAVGKVSQIGDIAIPLVGGLHTIVCRPLIDTADGYLGYYMNSQYYHSQLLPYITGIKVSSISKKSLEQTELHIPSKVSEQAAIVSVIAAFDAHIENLSALIEKKRAVRDGALEDLISGRTRLDGFTAVWKRVNFNQVITPHARIGWQGLKKDEYLTTGYSYLIGGTDFHKGTVSLENISYVSEERYAMDYNIQVSENDVLVTKDGTIGKVALVPKLAKPATLNSGVFVFRTKPTLEAVFLYWVLRSSIFKSFIETPPVSKFLRQSK